MMQAVRSIASAIRGKLGAAVSVLGRLSVSQRVVAVLLAAAGLICLLFAIEAAVEPALLPDRVYAWSSFLGPALTALFAMLGVLHDVRIERRVTRWGWLSILGVTACLLLSLVANSIDDRRAEARTRALVEETRRAASRIVALRFLVRLETEMIPRGWRQTLLSRRASDPTGIDASPNRTGYFASACAQGFPDFGEQDLRPIGEMLARPRFFIAIVDPMTAVTLGELFETWQPEAEFGTVRDTHPLVEQLLRANLSGGLWTTFAYPLESFASDCGTNRFSLLALGDNSDEEVLLIGAPGPEIAAWHQGMAMLSAMDLKDKYFVFWTDLSLNSRRTEYLSFATVPGGIRCFPRRVLTEHINPLAGRLVVAPVAKSEAHDSEYC